MKAKPFRPTKAPRLTGRGPSDAIERAALVALIAARIPRDRSDDERTVRNRVSAKIGYDLRKGKLRSERPGVFLLGDVSAWARLEWPGRFDDVPTWPGVAVASLSLPPFKVWGTGYQLPNNLKELHAGFAEMWHRIVSLTLDLSEQTARARDNEPVIEKWRGWINKKRKAQK